MTVEYTLLTALFVFFVLGALIRGPNDAFDRAAPKLGARVENQMITGEGFTRGGANAKGHQWRSSTR